MAYENFTSFYDVETQVYIPDYSDHITSTRGAGPFPYTDLVPSISIRCAGSYDWPNCGRACCLEGNAYSESYVADIVAYDPSDSSKYAVCTTVHPTLSKVERSDSSPYYHKGYLKLPEQVISLPLTASAWNFYGGLLSLSKNLAIAIVVHQENYRVDLASYVNVREGTTSSTWLQYEHTIISERYANSIDTYPLFAERATKDQNGDVIDTTYLKSANATGVKKFTTSLPPVSTPVAELDFFTNGRVRCDSSDMGLLAPYPSQSDSGKILQATWAGSPSVGGAVWVHKPRGVPASVVADEGKVLTVNNQGAAEWQKREHYFAGNGLTETTALDTGDITFDWAYTVGRNLTVNPNNQLCVSMPGALDDASATANDIFYPVANGDFAGAYVLMTRQKANGTYDIGLRYTASGTSSTFSFVGAETVVANDNTITVNPAVYMSQTVTYSGNKFGSATFNPTTHKAIYYSGLAMIGHISDTKIAIFKDGDGNVKVAFTSMEAKVW